MVIVLSPSTSAICWPWRPASASAGEKVTLALVWARVAVTVTTLMSAPTSAVYWVVEGANAGLSSAPPDRANSLSVASLDNGGSGSRVVDGPGSRVVDEPGSRVVDEPGSRVVDEPGSRVVGGSGWRVVGGVVRPPRKTVIE